VSICHHYTFTIDVKLILPLRIRLGDPKGGEKEWLLSDVIDDINGMSRFLYYDTFSDSDRFIPLPTFVPETALIPGTLTSPPAMSTPS
jgi:hypothetical protein